MRPSAEVSPFFRLARIERLQGRGWERLLAPHWRLPEPSLLRTHPSTEARIERLRALAAPPRPRLPTGPGGLHPPLSPAPAPRRSHLWGLWS
ncbi:hypothetical protein [Marichromatium gracile]|uniref:hypothetical protein n=1 Tax=Marichromatium gracile TaxID=1048 RepID=UPI001F5BD15A|nr:hypothetical protein [Marichromatium gracile]